ncbi:Beta-lactamase-like protein 2 [Coemansia sp. RSA 1752]|nr:Beta-lactamase-like protein 2 [Coemansia sp. RSA 1752]
MQTFEVGDVRLQATYTPGHTDDHMAFIVTNNNADVAVDERLLVTGDLVLGRGTTIVYDLQQYMNSLDRVLGIRPTMLLPGHGPIISGSKDDTPNAVRVIEGYIAHRNMREQQIIAVLARSPPNAPPIPRNGGWRLEEVTSAVYTDITDPRIIIAAQNNTRLHLNKLLFEGRVNTDGDLWMFVN